MLGAAVLLAGAALGLALASENFGGLVPCALCLVERWPYRVAIGLGVVGLVLPRVWARLALVLVLASFLGGGGGRGGACGGGGEMVAESAAGMHGAEPVRAEHRGPRRGCRRRRPSRARTRTYLISKIPLSMAQMNLIYALALSAWLVEFLWTTRRSPV